MAATIKTKIRTTTGGTPSTTAGELCVNTFDKKIFIGDGAASVELANQIGYNTITTLGTISTGTWSATAIGATKGGTGQTTYAAGDLIYSSATDVLSKLAKPAATSVLSMTSGGVPSWNGITGTGSTVFGTSPSISTLAISTTGSANKTAAINMASGVTSSNVTSTITLNGYNSVAPSTWQGVIQSGAVGGYDLKLYGQGVAFIGINTNTMYLGDVDGAGSGGVISFDGEAGTVDITGILSLTTGTEVSVSGKVLTCMDGSGTAEWRTPTSGTPDYVLFNLGII